MNKFLSVVTNDSNIGARLGLSFGLLISIVVCLGLVGLKHVRADAELEEIIDARLSKVQLSRQAQAYSNLNNRITMQLFLLKDEKEINSLLVERANNSEKISVLIETLRTKIESPAEAQLLDAIEERRTPYLRSYKRALQLLEVDKKSAEAKAVMVQESLPLLLRYHGAWNAYVDYQGNQLNQAQSTASANHFTTRIAAFLLISLAILLAVAIAFLVTRNLTRHMTRRKLAEEALREAHDELEIKVRERTSQLAATNEELQEEIDARELIETELRNSEERYREIVDGATDMIYRLTPAGHFTFVNPAAAAAVKRSVEECGGLHFLSLIRSDFREGAIQFYQQQVREKVPVTYFEFPVIAKDGAEIWLGQNVQLEIENGEVVELQAVGRDITTRKEIEERLVESERRYRLLFESNPQPMWVFDAETLAFLAVNDAAVLRYGYSREEFLCMTIKDIRPAADIPALFEHKAKAIDGFGSYDPSCAWRHRKKDGSIIDVEITWHTLNFAGRPAKLVLAQDITERKLAEKETLLQTARFQQLFENAPMGILRVDQNDIVLDANKEFEGIFQFSLDEMRGRAINEIVVPEAQRQEGGALSSRVLSGEIIDLEAVRQRKDGTLIPVQIYGVPIVVNQKSVGVFAIYVDLSEHKRAEEVLKESQEWLTAVYQSSRDGIIVEENEHIVYVNRSYANLFGYEPEDLIGQPVWLVSEQEPSERMLEYSRRRKRGEEAPSLYEFRGTRKDRTTVDLEASVSTAKMGAKTCIISLCRDITERKRMEQEREVIFEIIQGVIATADLDELLKLIHDSISKIVYAENCFVALHDPKTDLLSFEFWVDKFDPAPPPRPVGIGFSSYVLRTGEPILLTRQLTAEMVARGEVTQSGTSSPSWLGVPLRTPSRTIGVLAVQHYEEEHAYSERDLEFLTSVGNQIALAVERKRTELELRISEEQLRQSQKMEGIGTLAGGIAHDFNNLMTAVTGYSELALRGLEMDDPLRPKIEEIKKAGDRAASLTRQLLAFSRKQILQPRVLDLNTVVTGMGKMLPRIIGEDIDLRIELGGSLGQIKADPGQIEQVLMNLAVNARDAMPEGGRLTIKTENVQMDGKLAKRRLVVEPGIYVMLSVADNGCGMDAETRAHIFEPFYTTKEVGKGTGLGLSTVYGIVKQSGGSIWVYSEVEKGTIFKIYLPRVDEVVETAESFGKLRPVPRGHETILLVEDEEMVRDLCEEILEAYGYAVIVAPDGKEGLRVCQEFQGRIDLLITDVVMPQMSGRELAEKVTALRPDTRVLYMSGFTDDAVVRHGVLDDGVFFIQKPFSPDSLALKAREVLDHGGSSPSDGAALISLQSPMKHSETIRRN